MKYIEPPKKILKVTENAPDWDEQLEMAKEMAMPIIEVCNANGASVLFDDFKYGVSAVKWYAKLNGVRPGKMKNLEQDFSAAVGANVIVETTTDKPGHVALYIPQKERIQYTMGDFMARHYSKALDGSIYTFPLGENYACDLDKYHHLLIAGASGSGKSVCINSIIMGLLYRTTPGKCAMMMIDPKRVELAPYNGIPHLMCPVVTDAKEAVKRLSQACALMDKRYEEMSKVGARDMDEYAKATGAWPQRLVIIIDELADLMMTSGKAVEDYIVRIAQKGRACGFHLVIATQEPRASVVTGLIAANIPNRIAFKTATSRQSVIILGHGGAEKLAGMGDMLFQASDSPERPIRMQGVYVSSEEVAETVKFIKENNPDPAQEQEEPKAETRTETQTETPSYERLVAQCKQQDRQFVKWIACICLMCVACFALSSATAAIFFVALMIAAGLFITKHIEKAYEILTGKTDEADDPEK